MTEIMIHKLLLSYGLLPMMTVLEELVENEDYEKCMLIRDGIASFKEKYSYVLSAEKAITSEQDYIEYYEDLKRGYSKIAKHNMQYYIKDIKLKLEL